MADASNFTSMQPEDILTLIEDAEKVLDQKIAAEKADLEARRLKLEKLEARRASGKPAKGRPAGASKVGKPRKANGHAELSAAVKAPAHTNGATETPAAA